MTRAAHARREAALKNGTETIEALDRAIQLIANGKNCLQQPEEGVIVRNALSAAGEILRNDIQRLRTFNSPTLRDQFAMAALSGLLASNSEYDSDTLVPYGRQDAC